MWSFKQPNLVNYTYNYIYSFASKNSHLIIRELVSIFPSFKIIVVNFKDCRTGSFI